MLLVSNAWRASFTSSRLSSTSRISMILSFMESFSFFQGKVERCTAVGLSLSPDTTAMSMDNSLHDGQADTGSFIVFRPMQSLEDAKQLVGILHVEANAVVPDEVGPFARFIAHATADLDQC